MMDYFEDLEDEIARLKVLLDIKDPRVKGVSRCGEGKLLVARIHLSRASGRFLKEHRHDCLTNADFAI